MSIQWIQHFERERERERAQEWYALLSIIIYKLYFVSFSHPLLSLSPTHWTLLLWISLSSVFLIQNLRLRIVLKINFFLFLILGSHSLLAFETQCAVQSHIQSLFKFLMINEFISVLEVIIVGIERERERERESENFFFDIII